jgi:hypothetical protein
VTRGLAALRSRRGASAAPAALVLAAGTHFVAETLALAPADSHLSIVAAPRLAAYALSPGRVRH